MDNPKPTPTGMVPPTIAVLPINPTDVSIKCVGAALPEQHPVDFHESLRAFCSDLHPCLSSGHVHDVYYRKIVMS